MIFSLKSDVGDFSVVVEPIGVNWRYYNKRRITPEPN